MDGFSAAPGQGRFVLLSWLPTPFHRWRVRQHREPGGAFN